ncbi:hypothetical protein [Marinitenerispora sediminis]|nr:hypothetical protein [Marinitenerispora sediminis]
MSAIADSPREVDGNTVLSIPLPPAEGPVRPLPVLGASTVW